MSDKLTNDKKVRAEVESIDLREQKKRKMMSFILNCLILKKN